MVDFRFNKLEDRYYITNNETTDVTYVLKKLYDCTDFLEIFDGTIAAGEQVEILLTGDGEYQVLLTNSSDEESTVVIKHYLELQTSFIEDVYSVLCQCECGCKDCTELDIDEFKALLMTQAKIETFKRLTNPRYVAYLDAAYQLTNCLIKEDVTCIITEECVKGSSIYNEHLTKKLIALDYLAIYLAELNEACLNDSKAYIREKFKTAKILCCIKKLGINVNEIEDNLNMGTFTINSQAYVNLPPSVVGDNTLSVLNRAMTTLTLAMFTTGTTPAYADPENDPVVDVRIDTLPADGQLLLNGTPVTAGQVIPVADINANLLVFNSPNQDPADTDVFTFSLRDAGSGQFAS
mgnify:CR=1 FL=1